MRILVEVKIDESSKNIVSDNDIIILKGDNTFEVIPKYTKSELLEAKSEISKMLSDMQYEDIKKNMPENNSEAWEILTKLNEHGYINSTEILKNYLVKVSECKDITKLFQKLLGEWSTTGEASVSEIEKIINSCGGRK